MYRREASWVKHVVMSRQNDNVRFQQSRNVLLNSVKLDGWKNRRC